MADEDEDDDTGDSPGLPDAFGTDARRARRVRSSPDPAAARRAPRRRAAAAMPAFGVGRDDVAAAPPPLAGTEPPAPPVPSPGPAGVAAAGTLETIIDSAAEEQGPPADAPPPALAPDDPLGLGDAAAPMGMGAGAADTVVLEGEEKIATVEVHKLERKDDESGVSGTGTVAIALHVTGPGMPGRVIMVWRGLGDAPSSMTIYGSMADAEHVHVSPHSAGASTFTSEIGRASCRERV